MFSEVGGFFLERSPTGGAGVANTGGESRMRDQTRNYVENRFALTMKELKQWFVSGQGFAMPPLTVTHSFGGQVTQRHVIRLEGDDNSLVCRVRSDGARGVSEREFSISIEKKLCNYGGSRLYFRCPHCGKRCLKLYLGGGYFVCRECAGLHYLVESEDAAERARRRAEKIRRRLGWKRMGLPEYADLLGRPKHMHYRTFARLCDKHDKAVGECLGAYLSAAMRLSGGL